MFLRYAKFDPNGNTTILVLDDVPRSRQARVAEQLMNRADLQAEQVGFLEAAERPGARIRLQMMGGEFCGNATMSLAAWLARQDSTPLGEEKSCLLEVSGAERAIACNVRPIGEDCFEGEVPMPLPQEILETELLPGCAVPLVRFDGIVHAILPEGAMSDAQAQAILPRACAELDADAMGLIFASERSDRIRPLVYVRETQSCVWESGCGSGTAALGAWRAAVQGANVNLRVVQACPQNCIGVAARYENGRVSGLRIRGKVRLLNAGWARIDDEEGFD